MFHTPWSALGTESWPREILPSTSLQSTEEIDNLKSKQTKHILTNCTGEVQKLQGALIETDRGRVGMGLSQEEASKMRRVWSMKSDCCCLLTKWVMLCSTLCDPIDCSLPGSSVHWISQAKILEWFAISFSRESSPPRDWTCISCTGRQILYQLSQQGSSYKSWKRTVPGRCKELQAESQGWGMEKNFMGPLAEYKRRKLTSVVGRNSVTEVLLAGVCYNPECISKIMWLLHRGQFWQDE